MVSPDAALQNLDEASFTFHSYSTFQHILCYTQEQETCCAKSPYFFLTFWLQAALHYPKGDNNKLCHISPNPRNTFSWYLNVFHFMALFFPKSGEHADFFSPKDIFSFPLEALLHSQMDSSPYSSTLKPYTFHTGSLHRTVRSTEQCWEGSKSCKTAISESLFHFLSMVMAIQLHFCTQVSLLYYFYLNKFALSFKSKSFFFLQLIDGGCYCSSLILNFFPLNASSSLLTKDHISIMINTDILYQMRAVHYIWTSMFLSLSLIFHVLRSTAVSVL